MRIQSEYAAPRPEGSPKWSGSPRHMLSMAFAAVPVVCAAIYIDFGAPGLAMLLFVTSAILSILGQVILKLPVIVTPSAADTPGVEDRSRKFEERAVLAEARIETMTLELERLETERAAALVAIETLRRTADDERAASAAMEQAAAYDIAMVVSVYRGTVLRQRFAPVMPPV